MQQIFTISRRRAKMAAMDIFKLPPSRVKPISVFRAMPQAQPIEVLERASSATESMCYRLPTWRHGLVRVWLQRINPQTVADSCEQEPPLRLRSGRGRSLYVLFQSVAPLYCFNLSSTSFSSSLLLQVFPVDIRDTKTQKQPTLFSPHQTKSLIIISQHSHSFDQNSLTLTNTIVIHSESAFQSQA